MYEGFTGQSRRVLLLAHREAHRFRHDYLGTEHVLLGVLLDGARRVAALLQAFGVSVDTVRVEVEKTVCQGSEVTVGAKLPLTPPARRALGFAGEEAVRLRHDRVGPEHLLLGVLHEEAGEAAQVLLGLGLDLERLREEILKLPPPEDRDAMVKPAGAPGAVLALDPSAWELEWLVSADGRPTPITSSARSMPSVGPLLSAPSLDGLTLQLRITQLVLGALAGGVAGSVVQGQNGAIVGVLAGLVVAVVRSTVLGVALGTAFGMLIGRFQPALSLAVQMLATFVGVLIGCCLGTFFTGFTRKRPSEERGRSGNGPRDEDKVGQNIRKQ